MPVAPCASRSSALPSQSSSVFEPSHTSGSAGETSARASSQSPLLVTLPATAEHELTAVAVDEPKPSLSPSV